MNVLVTGAHIENKGDELMVFAIRQQLKEIDPDIRIVRERWSSTYEYRAKMGFYELLPAPQSLRRWLAYTVLKRHQKPLGLVEEKDLDFIIDSSGFAYTDDWGPGNAVRSAERFERWKQNGTKIIMLPQSFGPFSNPETIAAMKKIVELSDLVYARDESSYGLLVEALGEHPHLRSAPDFTNLMRGVVPNDFDAEGNYGIIVPNHWLVKKTPEEKRVNYFNFLAAAIAEMRKYDLQPLILLHAPFQDAELVTAIEAAVGGALPVVEYDDPLLLKGVLGTGRIVIASRFHALMGALSQAIPSIGLGWSHKFDRLFELYDCSDYLVDALLPEDGLREKIAQLLKEPTRSAHIDKLTQAMARNEQRVHEMWSEVTRVMKGGAKDCS